MTRAPTGNETKRQSNGALPSNPRLVAASKRALEAHARVRRLATHLSEELERSSDELEYDASQGIPLELDREDSMVVAVEKVIATAKSTTPPPIAEMTSSREEIASPRTATRRGVVSLRKPTGG